MIYDGHRLDLTVIYDDHRSSIIDRLIWRPGAPGRPYSAPFAQGPSHSVPAVLPFFFGHARDHRLSFFLVSTLMEEQPGDARSQCDGAARSGLGAIPADLFSNSILPLLSRCEKSALRCSCKAMAQKAPITSLNYDQFGKDLWKKYEDATFTPRKFRIPLLDAFPSVRDLHFCLDMAYPQVISMPDPQELLKNGPQSDLEVDYYMWLGGELETLGRQVDLRWPPFPLVYMMRSGLLDHSFLDIPGVRSHMELRPEGLADTHQIASYLQVIVDYFGRQVLVKDIELNPFAPLAACHNLTSLELVHMELSSGLSPNLDPYGYIRPVYKSVPLSWLAALTSLTSLKLKHRIHTDSGKGTAPVFSEIQFRDVRWRLGLEHLGCAPRLKVLHLGGGEGFVHTFGGALPYGSSSSSSSMAAAIRQMPFLQDLMLGPWCAVDDCVAQALSGLADFRSLEFWRKRLSCHHPLGKLETLIRRHSDNHSHRIQYGASFSCIELSYLLSGTTRLRRLEGVSKLSDIGSASCLLAVAEALQHCNISKLYVEGDLDAYDIEDDYEEVEEEKVDSEKSDDGNTEDDSDESAMPDQLPAAALQPLGKTLTELVVACTSIQQKWIKALVRSLPCLSHLSLKDCKIMDGALTPLQDLLTLQCLSIQSGSLRRETIVGLCSGASHAFTVNVPDWPLSPPCGDFDWARYLRWSALDVATGQTA
eukprot:gene14240-20212_t